MGAGYDPYEDAPRIWFSAIEVLHLTVSVVLLTGAFALVLSPCPDPKAEFCIDRDWPKFVGLLPFAALAVVPAFILHELAHKIVAQRKDMWAEFRSNFMGLGIGIVAGLFAKMLLAIPGAVYIYGDADRRDSGIISIVGPMVNLVIGYVAFIVASVKAWTWHLPDVSGFGVNNAWQLIVIINALLAAFNMLPVGPLDGLKVWRWSIIGFFGMWALIAALGLLVFPDLIF